MWLGGRWGRGLRRGRLLVDPELVDMQPLDLKILDLELPHHRPSNRQPTYRQGTNRAGSNSHRPNRGRPDASRYKLHRRTLLPAVAKHGKRSGRPSLGLHSRVLSTRQSHGPILTYPNVSLTVLTRPPALSSVNRPPLLAEQMAEQEQPPE